MIDWKDVTKEVPKEDSDVFIRYIGYRNNFKDYDKCTYGRNRFFNDNHFFDCEDDFLSYDDAKITHWSYINEPKEEIR